MNEQNGNKCKEELDRIELPEDSKKAVLERIRSAGAGESAPESVFKKRFPVRRVILIAAAVTVLAALAVGLFVWLRPEEPSVPEPDEPSAVIVNTSDGKDWVKELFESPETIQNDSGVVQDDPVDTSAAMSGKSDGISWWKEERGSAGDTVYEMDPEPVGEWKEDGYGMIDGYIDGEHPYELEPVTPGEPGYPVIDGNGSGSPSAGTLTAGRRDDNALFGEFLTAMEELKAYASSWRLYPTKRITVRVEDCANALVALTDAKGEVLSYARTNVNGYAYLYYDLYTENGQSVPKKIGISSGDAFGEYTLTGEENGSVTLKLENGAAASDKLDVLIMLDTTGSMGDELTYLQAELEDVMKRVKKEAGNARVRLSVNFYRDRGDAYTVSYNPFTEDFEECRNLLLKQYADGGGDFPEAVDEALVNAVCDHAWDADAVKVMFLILDAPPHEESERQGTRANIRKAVESAQKQGIRIVPVVASGIDDTTEYLMRSLAASTGGVYAFLTDHSGVGNGHADPHEVQYSVEKLNDLMVQVILSYWKKDPNAGQSPEPKPDPVDQDAYRIQLTGDSTDLIISCPQSAQEGETVEIRTHILYDADIRLFVDGEAIPQTHYDSDYWAYTFTMPGHDVTVRMEITDGFLPDISDEESGGEVILPELPIG